MFGQDPEYLTLRFKLVGHRIDQIEPLQVNRSGDMTDAFVAAAVAAVPFAVAPHVPND